MKRSSGIDKSDLFPYTDPMATGKRRRRARQPSIWVANADLPWTAGHPFYEGLNHALGELGLDAFVEQQCAKFYADGTGRPSLLPGRYFRMLLLGSFGGLELQRAMAWRVPASLSLRRFLDIALHEASPDHSTVSWMRRRIDIETHEAIFTRVLQRVSDAGLLKGKTVGIDATTLEANNDAFLHGLASLAAASGIPTPTRTELARLDRKRPKKGSNDDWTHLQDPDARIMKALTTAGEQVEAVLPPGGGVAKFVSGKATTATRRWSLLVAVADLGLLSYVSVPDRATGDANSHPAMRYMPTGGAPGGLTVGAYCARAASASSDRTPILYDTGGQRRVHLRGHASMQKRHLVHASGLNFDLLMRRLAGVGTPRSLQGCARTPFNALKLALSRLWRRASDPGRTLGMPRQPRFGVKPALFAALRPRAKALRGPGWPLCPPLPPPPLAHWGRGVNRRLVGRRRIGGTQAQDRASLRLASCVRAGTRMGDLQWKRKPRRHRRSRVDLLRDVGSAARPKKRAGRMKCRWIHCSNSSLPIRRIKSISASAIANRGA